MIIRDVMTIVVTAAVAGMMVLMVDMATARRLRVVARVMWGVVGKVVGTAGVMRRMCADEGVAAVTPG